ncbi:hypothetical protein [Bradyrhizobium genosp. SA-3]|uniref:hypothetical protein n=1 Tax=Bradyrhizobium genosp. SA-3 TaxID=508868 RepID=UPI001FDFA1D0|nr:hypothetical protein [Bradyrhizobium genosp. SA-3]
MVRELVQGRYRCGRRAFCRQCADAQSACSHADGFSGRHGHENIRAYWRKAYGHIESADLKILGWSWDEAIARLTVWWQLGDTRASEFMDFDDAGRVVRSEAFYGK